MIVMQRSKLLLLGLAIIGCSFLTACGGEGRNADRDSAGITTDTAALTPDTAPAAETPPGAINPGEDSSRYGTGAGDSSKNRRPE